MFLEVRFNEKIVLQALGSVICVVYTRTELTEMSNAPKMNANSQIRKTFSDNERKKNAPYTKYMQLFILSLGKSTL